ncbi:putative uncharacterized protein [Pseudomonas sp. StFLB209]|uniref:hypothetical protein n=1 Tax=Pseudomonas sp. StFLB209 TaxID=1028989 RepID=UPI0004F69FF9|nr:hypothetical protein [Pseudomonas sp. StFLB209]BAP44741.1 putative uncharacterized protein [Pseudomonas sp. StFLB209]
MNYFIVDERTLTLFSAQANLNGTFQHSCIAARSNERRSFSLQVDRGPQETTFTVVMRDERHTLTLRRDERRIHLRLAEFVEAIANGRLLTISNQGSGSNSPPHAGQSRFDPRQTRQLLSLIGRGGFLSLELGLPCPLQVALHRTGGRDAITAILNLGLSRPQTSCFTVYGSDNEAFELLTESIEHLVTSRSPAANLA